MVRIFPLELETFRVYYSQSLAKLDQIPYLVEPWG